jgi:hypothetical protein
MNRLIRFGAVALVAAAAGCASMGQPIHAV